MMKRIIASRRHLLTSASPGRKTTEEGGCGVVGFASSVPVRGRHIHEPSIQMHNRGNGKGGGIAAASMRPQDVGVDARVLRDDYLLQIALLDPGCRGEVEEACITPVLDVDHTSAVTPAADHRDVGLEVKPPDVVRYFVRVKRDALERFASEAGLEGEDERAVEDEFVYQNSVRLNQRFYASMGEQRAFVLSHARDLMIFKIVGYAEQVVEYYGLEDTRARIWIAHQRYPTKGRVWHPAGSHPFIGMNEALVHNGDFANYHSVSEYLGQHNIVPQFLTDTEVSALIFDLHSRVYGYPLEHVIEAMAPTTELDFDRLPEERQDAYRAIQARHMHGSPDGPWFFIIARSDPTHDRFMLLGITDTAMLRPQVFALQEGDVSIGLVASEKQAIDATLHSLASEDSRFRLVADRYWNARGGSSSDGGAFSFTVQDGAVTCADKFGTTITVPRGEYRLDLETEPAPPAGAEALVERLSGADEVDGIFDEVASALPAWNLQGLRWFTSRAASLPGDRGRDVGLELLTLMNDRRYDCGGMKRSALLEVVRGSIDALLSSVPCITQDGSSRHRGIGWDTREGLRPPRNGEEVLVIDATGFAPEGDDCDSRLAVRAHAMGWRRFVVHRLRGQRFAGSGFGMDTGDVRLDVYGSSGDYLASGMDGMQLRVHDNGQDQLAQIMKDGTLVVYGDVGQAFLYGGKGGNVYVMGNAAGRPLINAVGRPRVVINGTALDYLAESFMAGDPHAGGGFVVLNGIRFDDRGRVVELETPYPGANLFSLASGGAIFVRDPHRRLIDEQLNGGGFTTVTDADWKLITPYLERNEELFGISIERDLLTVDGTAREPADVYRKVQAVRLAVLSKVQVPE
jgi:glutamate synthase domain-containing protein 1/glutamate synthase domain-containing protein 3